MTSALKSILFDLDAVDFKVKSLETEFNPAASYKSLKWSPEKSVKNDVAS